MVHSHDASNERRACRCPSGRQDAGRTVIPVIAIDPRATDFRAECICRPGRHVGFATSRRSWPHCARWPRWSRWRARWARRSRRHRRGLSGAPPLTSRPTHPHLVTAADGLTRRFVIGSATSEVLGGGHGPCQAAILPADMSSARWRAIVPVMGFVAKAIIATRQLLRRGPYMGGASADGRTLWRARYSAAYASNTRIGRPPVTRCVRFLIR